MKAVLLILGVCLASLSFWIIAGALLQYVWPEFSPVGIAIVAIMGHFGTVLIACSATIKAKD